MAIKIMIDPGHMYGYNKATSGYAEGTRMWDLGQLLIPKLRAYGFTVGCTRTDTYSYPGKPGDDNITQRGRMAAGYDLMLSLHTNACGTESVKRPVVIYPVSGRSKGLADLLAKALHEMLGNTDSPSYQTFCKWNSAGNADYYGVIRGAASVGVPCLIVEHMFHTNPECALWMMSEYNLNRMAQVVADTVAEYYGVKSEKKNGWVKESGKWYYYKEDQKMADKWVWEDGDLYYLGADGAMATEGTLQVGADGKVRPAEVEFERHYNKVKDVTEAWYRPTIDKLVEKGILHGKSGTGEDMVLDFGEGTIRTLVILDRAGVFGEESN